MRADGDVGAEDAQHEEHQVALEATKGATSAVQYKFKVMQILKIEEEEAGRIALLEHNFRRMGQRPKHDEEYNIIRSTKNNYP